MPASGSLVSRTVKGRRLPSLYENFNLTFALEDNDWNVGGFNTSSMDLVTDGAWSGSSKPYKYGSRLQSRRRKASLSPIGFPRCLSRDAIFSRGNGAPSLALSDNSCGLNVRAKVMASQKIVIREL